ncbi:CD1871A family CXXC motif-containing protein [Clostridium ganghwense]|uniref:CD1871A family CXXC motif-containing protein n=1 Tax=Clostridium ganghwense TaxID=312089 RepID=A0ABT4CT43_9CLOT|nr:CD1871A family CXXC motif-containing protein [Clostridium ganghwense]MCY6372246.1 CD1871A family CXXC motif-containing protein [Clostridium ganghwense]
MKGKLIRIGLLFTGAAFIIMGTYRGEVGKVFNKAIRICLECIGIG